MKRFIHISALIVLFVSLGYAQQFTLEQIMSAPFSEQLVAAKSAPRIAWITNLSGVRNIFVADAPGYQPRQVTHYPGDDGQTIAALAITPDGKTLVYARGSEVNDAGDSANPQGLPVPPKQQVWAVSAEGGEPKLLGDMGCPYEGCEDIQISPDGKWAVWVAKKGLMAASIDEGLQSKSSQSSPGAQFAEMQGTPNSPRWSPDGKQIAFEINRKTHALIAVADVNQMYEQSGTLRHDSISAGRIQWLSPSVDRDALPRWSSDGKQIAFVRTPGAENRVPIIPLPVHPWSIWVAQVKPALVGAEAANQAATTDPAKEIWHSGTTSRDSVPEFLGAAFGFAQGDAGARVIFVSEHDNWPHLYSIPATGGEPVLLTPGEYSIEDVSQSRDHKALIYTSNEGNLDTRHVWRVAASGGTPTPISKGDAFEFTPVEAANGDILALGSSANTPNLPLNISNGQRQEIAASLIPQQFPKPQLLTPTVVTFPSTDNVTIHGQLFMPPQCKNAKCPALIFTHGGPPRQMLTGFSYMNYYSNAYAENQYLASRGYVVLSVNYRNGIMYGHDFQYPTNGVWRGAVEYNDVVAGAKYLQSLPQVDAAHMGLWGGSYGGFLTAMGLAHDSDIFKAGVDYHGVHDWSVFLPEWEEDAKNAPDLKEAIALAIKSSPVGAMETWRSPVLLVHGDDDRNVPFRQDTDLVQRLKKQHVEFQEMIFPDEIHDLLLWRDWINSYRAAQQFFDQHLK